jgi:Ca2+-binding EF-hand superfamily protein
VYPFSQAFLRYDTDGSGLLEEEEFKQALTDMKVSVTDTQFQHLLRELDEEGAGGVNFEQFCHAIQTLRVDLSDSLLSARGAAGALLRVTSLGLVEV